MLRITAVLFSTLSFIALQSALLPSHLQASTETSQPTTSVITGSDSPITFCGDKAGWPPYTYEDGNTLKGYDLDVLARIFEPTGQAYKVQMLPWRRCLEMVKEGQVDVALSASGNEERAITYRMSMPYYYVTPSYIYLKSRFPEGLDIPPSEITKNYKVCGLRGYSYHSFGLLPEKVETTSRTFNQLFHKTAAGRCDLLLGRYEVLLGFALTGTPLLTDIWQHTPVPGIEPDDFRMLVSRATNNSLELHKLLNKRITEMRDSGELDRLLQPYLK